MLKYFKESEFTMDGKPVFKNMDPTFLQVLDNCRGYADVPFKITSSFRDAKKNKSVGGSPNSMHLKGRAVDIVCLTGEMRAVIIAAALKFGLSVGVMRSGLHLDNRETQIVFDYYARYGEGVSENE